MSSDARGESGDEEWRGSSAAGVAAQEEVPAHEAGRAPVLRGTLRGGANAPAEPAARTGGPTNRLRSIPPEDEGERKTHPAILYCRTCQRAAGTDSRVCPVCAGALVYQVASDPPRRGVPTSPKLPSFGTPPPFDAANVSELGVTASVPRAGEEETEPVDRSGTIRSNRPPALGTHTLGYSGHGSARPSMYPERREGAAPLSRVDPLIGMVIADRYRIVEPLGRGGMGIVYKVEHVRIGKLLAMKLLAGELSMNPEVVKRFKHEALTVSKLSSAHTVQVFDYGASDGLTYLVMELVAGEDLGKLLRARDTIHPTKLCEIVVQVCDSLAEAHIKGIVHRDIKPENLMITRGRDDNDFAKVLDFGLAKLREGSELNELTSQGAIVGTPYFMSPEQVRGDDVDARSDVYSLGAVMYRALCGDYVFNGTTPMVVFAKHLTEPVVPPHERNPELEIPLGMSRIVTRCLSKDPAERYERVEDLRAALEGELESCSTSGVESILDSGVIARIAETKAAQGQDPLPSPVATRDEVEAYERKLRNRRWFTVALGALVPLAMAAAGLHFYARYRAAEGRFAGGEIEPNDQAGQATDVPFGSTVSATLGKRSSPSQSDIDVFAVDIEKNDAPGPTRPADKLGDGSRLVSLKVKALPNIAMCTQLFRKGVESPMAQFCTGKVGLPLEIPRFKLAPGSYLFTVLEDMNPYGGEPRFVLENVSDEYSLSLDDAVFDPSQEVEPNDSQHAANAMTPGSTFEGRLGWVGDKDVVCAQGLAPASNYRFRIADEPRDGVLAVSVLLPSGETPMVRVHAESVGRPASALAETDQLSPATTSTFEGSKTACAVLQATVNPLVKDGAQTVPRGSSSVYRVTLEEVIK